jgi:hypothetical protein
MIESQKDLTAYCAALSEKIQPACLPESVVEKISQLDCAIRKQELLIPVVGAFSSGKSTLINKILGESRLPVAITPETSLATELRFSAEPRIEAVKEDGGIIHFGIDEIKTLTENAAQYSHARLYLDNPCLRDIEPLVLVDMPGFDSPLDAHNKAIMAYIECGCHYLVLASVQEGTVSKSLLRRIREIGGLRRGMSFFLSKADLKPQGEVDELVAHFAETLRDNCDYTGEVVPVSQFSPDAVVRLLKGIDAENLFFSLYRDAAQNTADALVDAINTRINALKKDGIIVSSAVAELQNALVKLQNRAEDEIDSLSRRYSGSDLINAIVSDAGKALENALEELVGIARGGDMAATERCLNEIVRSELNVSVNRHLGEVNQEIVSDLSDSLKNLDRAMSDLGDNEFAQKLAAILQSQFSRLGISPVETVGKALSVGTITSMAAKASGIGLTAIVNPLLGVLVAFLPEILGWAFGQSRESQANEKLRTAFLGQVFPQIKSRIRPELQKLVTEATRGMIEKARAQYEAQIGQKKTELEDALREKDASKAEKEQAIATLEKVREAINAATEELLKEHDCHE